MAKEEYISGEKHKAMTSTKPPAKTIMMRPIVLVGGFVVVAIIGFYGGLTYQKHHQPKVNTTASTSSLNGTNQFGTGRRFGGAQRGALGKVTAISSTSITVANQRTNKDSTLSISDQTTVSNNGQTAAVTDIKVGDIVLVMPVQGNTSQAARILINPSFGGGPGANPSSSSPSSSQGPDTQLN